MAGMTKASRYEIWRKKLAYLVRNHGGLAYIASATGLKAKTVDQIVRGAPEAGAHRPPHLDKRTTEQIERSLDLPEGWFDASVFLPSRL